MKSIYWSSNWECQRTVNKGCPFLLLKPILMINKNPYNFS